MATVTKIQIFTALLFVGSILSFLLYLFGVNDVSYIKNHHVLNSEETAGNVPGYWPENTTVLTTHTSTQGRSENKTISHIAKVDVDRKVHSVNEANDSLLKNDVEPIIPPVNKQYLLPIHHFGSGPNYNYEHFRMAVLYALYSNRTIVESWFHTHFSQERQAIGWKYLNETFDVEELRRIVGVAYRNEFKRNCNGTVDIVIALAGTGDYERHLKLFNDTFGINLPEVLNDDVTIDDVSHVPCVGIYQPRNFAGRHLPKKDEILHLIDLHLTRPRVIQDMAAMVGNGICGGRSYISVHWRCKSGGSICNGNRTCLLALQSAMNKSAQDIAEDLLVIMRKRNVTCLYVALPSYAMEAIHYFKKKIPEVYSSEDLTNSAKFPTIAALRHDNYVISLLEQELCIRSRFFVEWTYSYWSHMVGFQRRLRKEETINIRNLPAWNSRKFGKKRR
ncbi:uncharacterized protein LOC100372659 [Saccoglossus kowalevskii]